MDLKVKIILVLLSYCAIFFNLALLFGTKVNLYCIIALQEPHNLHVKKTCRFFCYSDIAGML
jgi:hypothetical protein